jgi:hypothetical protein
VRFNSLPCPPSRPMGAARSPGHVPKHRTPRKRSRRADPRLSSSGFRSRWSRNVRFGPTRYPPIGTRFGKADSPPGWEIRFGDDNHFPHLRPDHLTCAAGRSSETWTPQIGFGRRTWRFQNLPGCAKCCRTWSYLVCSNLRVPRNRPVRDPIPARIECSSAHPQRSAIPGGQNSRKPEQARTDVRSLESGEHETRHC